MLECQRVLDISQVRLHRRTGNSSLEAGASVGDVSAKRVKPALCFLLQALKAAPACNFVAHRTLPPSRLKSAQYRLEEGSAMSARIGLGGKIPLPRTGGAPTRTLWIFGQRLAEVKRAVAPSFTQNDRDTVASRRRARSDRRIGNVT